MLNLGCGSRYLADPGWTNVDFVSTGAHVIAHDLLQGIPFPEGTFDAVYHSHVLEHFRREDAKRFLGECRRVLVPGGTLRVVVPDLEQICRLYLVALEKAMAGDPAWRRRYEWMMIELFDQAVRTTPGGEMERHLRSLEPADREFILARIGGVGRAMASVGEAAPPGKADRGKPRPWNRKAMSIVHAVRRSAAFLFLSRREKEALGLGLFRLGGEIHQWMYDGYSLSERLAEAGFEGVRRCGARESSIPGWATCGLDVGPDGFEHAPNSAYMEGTRPG